MIPDYQTLMLPVLKACKNREVSTKDTICLLAEEFSLTEEEKLEMLPSGKQTRFSNRVHWAKNYLKQAGLVRFTTRGMFAITDQGQIVLSEKPKYINNKYLEQFDGYLDFKNRKKTSVMEPQSTVAQRDEETDETPDEMLRSAHRDINNALGADLLGRVREASPDFFEQLIVDLLLNMGYGGSSEDAGRTIGKSGDDGVDGVINQDPLGVDQIYVQAKRYAEGNNIGSGAIRDFFGALNLKGAQKGIFFTTSKFSSAATDTAEKLNMRIVLIDGVRLSKLMIQYNVGCREEEILTLKKVDEDFFDNNQ
ncbi:restriction endonuclease [Curvivirga sp.]|uniref:restriction endonuclease n=1 Tax=Curvivirga sp. TaxID=2856848 RepID=UPI003B5CEBB5